MLNEITLHSVLRLRDGMQIFVFALTDKTITLDVEAYAGTLRVFLAVSGCRATI